MGTFTAPQIPRNPKDNMLGATLEARRATFFDMCFLLFCMSCWALGGTVFVATSPPPAPSPSRLVRAPRRCQASKAPRAPGGLVVLGAHWPVGLLEDEIQRLKDTAPQVTGPRARLGGTE